MSLICIEIPGRQPVSLSTLVLDFTGTLSKDGGLISAVAERLRALAERIRIIVMTADTFGKARAALEGLPLEVKIIQTGQEKASLVRQLGEASVVAIGNGRNDVPMCKLAVIGIGVIGPEGGAGELLACADVVTTNILDALDLLTNPLRLKATLRD